jgi:filamentous hemagglutinin family protein
MKFIVKNNLTRYFRRASAVATLLLASSICQFSAQANPTGGTVTQGAASFNTSGSQFTINQTSGNAVINWQSFNIGAGETTTFVQPSSSSVAFNQINDVNPSQILGNLNANGYVVLQNPNGFYVGGTAAITAHGLIMTTASAPAIDFSSTGPWSFNAPPPAAKIINYGKINVTGGGSAFLIASDIENNGTISAPGGKIGLYAGEQVLVSTSPDGRGLSAEVTLPTGSVDNEGKLIADAGSIAAQAKTVNQGGLIQANSAQNVNGTIELVAGDSLNVGASSVISAQGGGTGASSGGSVTLQSGNTFSDQSSSTISIAGGAQGGNGGQLEISAGSLIGIQSQIDGHASSGFLGGTFTIDPTELTLDSSFVSTLVPTLSSGLYQINLQADDTITLNTLWELKDPGSAALLTLTAGNDIIFNNGSGIIGDNNWSVSISAGPLNLSAKPTTSSTDGIYLDGTSFLQTQNGDINLWAANEVQVGWMGADTGSVNSGTGGISTTAGGNIDVTAQYGDVNTGSNPNGFLYKSPSGYPKKLLPPYYSVSTSLGGISTAAGGDVTITAGGNVTSYNPSGITVGADAGTGAFGSEPGNVTITAGGNVYGHYVVANGTGTITAGKDVGVSAGPNSVALSLIDGTWNVNAPNGNIYLQEVRNPNGIFNNSGGDTSVAAHLFDYAPDATVNLDAGTGVYLTDVSVPRLSADPIQVIYPPILNLTAGAGGVTLEGNVILFPSADQNLTINTTAGGDLQTTADPGSTFELLMSDSSQSQWFNSSTFSDTDHGTGVPVQAADSSASVNLDISGSMENLTLITTRATHITVDGDMKDCGFSGQNLSSSDITSIKVLGQIYNQSPYSFINNVNIPAIPASDLLPGMAESWDDIFTLALNPSIIASLTVPVGTQASQLASYAIQNAGLFSPQVLANGQLLGANPGFVFSSATGRFGYAGQMNQSVLAALGSGQITTLRLVNGQPVLDSNGHFLTDTVSWAPPSDIQTLYTDNLGAPSPINGQLGYRIGGPGQFDINAGSMQLGNTYGILSCDVVDPQGGYGRYANLVSLTPSGATVNVTVAGDLDMLTSTIATLGGGDVNVISTGGSMDLGSQELLQPPRQVGFGIYTSGAGDVNVTALDDIDIDGSRIAAYDGGNIFVESSQGNVNVGSGGNTLNSVSISYVNSAGIADIFVEKVAGSGILASTLVQPFHPGDASIPGNITVNTPQGDITATAGGILQEALNGNVQAGPTITLTAGTFPPGNPNNPGNLPEHAGNIDLGNSGVIGGTINLLANGNIFGVVISRQNSTVNAAQNFTGTLLSAGSADVSAGGSVAGTIIGVGGANVSGGSISAPVLGQNVAVNGGPSQSTLGKSANASTASQSASQQAAQSASQQVASVDADDDQKKRKHPTLQRMKRVTVILPKSS